MDDIEVRLNILEIGFAYTFQQHDGYFFAGMQIVGTDNLNNFSSDGFVAVMD